MKLALHEIPQGSSSSSFSVDEEPAPPEINNADRNGSRIFKFDESERSKANSFVERHSNQGNSSQTPNPSMKSPFSFKLNEISSSHTMYSSSYNDYLRKKNIDLSNGNDLKVWCIFKMVLATSKTGLLESHEKSEKDIDILKRSFKSLKFFLEIESLISKKNVINVYRNITVKTVDPLNKIVGVGDKSDSFFVVLTGSVIVLMPNQGIITDETSNIQSQNQNIFMGRRRDSDITSPISRKILNIAHKYKNKNNEKDLHTALNQGKDMSPSKMSHEMSKLNLKNNYDRLVEKMVLNSFPNMHIVKELGAGEFFGDDTILSNSLRTTTVVTKKQSNLLILNKDQYKTFLGAIKSFHRAIRTDFFILQGVGFSDLLREKVRFLNSFPIFSHWTETKLSTLLQFFEIKKFNKGEILYRENEAANSLYFIRLGEVELSKVNLDNEDVTTSDIDEFRNLIHSRKRERVKKFCILGPGNSFGEEEVVMNIPRMSRASCNSISEIFIIGKEDFLQNVRTNLSLKKLRDNIETKQNWRNERYETLQATSNFMRAYEEKPKKLELSYIKQVNKSQNQIDAIKGVEEIGYLTDRKSLTSIKYGLSVKQKVDKGYIGSKLGHERPEDKGRVDKLRNSEKFSSLMQDMKEKNEDYFLKTPIIEMFPRHGPKAATRDHSRKHLKTEQTKNIDLSLSYNRPSTTTYPKTVLQFEPPIKVSLSTSASNKRLKNLQTPSDSELHKTSNFSNIILPCTPAGCMLDPRILSSVETASKIGILEENPRSEIDLLSPAMTKTFLLKKMLIKHIECKGTEAKNENKMIPYLGSPFMSQSDKGYTDSSSKKFKNIHLIKMMQERSKLGLSRGGVRKKITQNES